MRTLIEHWLLVLSLLVMPLKARGNMCVEHIVSHLKDLNQIEKKLSSLNVEQILQRVLKSRSYRFDAAIDSCHGTHICGTRLPLGTVALKSGTQVDVDLVHFLGEEFIYAHKTRMAGSHLQIAVFDGYFFLLYARNVPSETQSQIGQISDFKTRLFQPTHLKTTKEDGLLETSSFFLLTPESFRQLISIPAAVTPSSKVAPAFSTPDVWVIPTTRFELIRQSDTRAKTMRGTTYFYGTTKIAGYCKENKCFKIMVSLPTNVGSHAAILKAQGIGVAPDESVSFDAARSVVSNFVETFDPFVPSRMNDHYNRRMATTHLETLLSRNPAYVIPEIKEKIRHHLDTLVILHVQWMKRARPNALENPNDNHRNLAGVFVDPTSDDIPIQTQKLYRFSLILSNPPHLILTRKPVLHDQMIRLVLGQEPTHTFVSTNTPSPLIYDFLAGGTFIITAKNDQAATVDINQISISLLGTGTRTQPRLKTLLLSEAQMSVLKSLLANYLGIPRSELELNADRPH